MIEIRKAQGSDFQQIWTILQEVFQKGDTYAFFPNITKEEVFQIWMEIPLATYVAVENELIRGTYYLKPNQPGLGSHVCNVGYAVSSNVRGKGIGRLMCEHSLNEAKAYAFKAMQYNYVVSTNQAAVELWKKCGFKIVGTLPKAFNHKEKGLVDAFVMYQWFN
ncbi:GNAT family N-acetyltransferase [Desulfosporosinus nitroreducens]|uniref:GNAT family N-acetyltransferase n=1 Tax=Desulfosporosinus nitroreducens TaxID=2018668 RepID=A0ABT8QNX4_9FIRM|nr:N-acetyltransferase [Desulfosporosinus nitroreducens]MCO1600739.1 GNAT family N-acetyltransferase [Desulfosporosinus nitroreducens]MDO0822299.1 GNAT family N-acetyltransferase [Desulfosporosinus nitroreducens]